jgi:hypothetical protein
LLLCIITVCRIHLGIFFNVLLPGNASELQVSVSVAEPLHAPPYFSAGVAACLVRVLVPPTHVAEQVDHSPYSPHTQSMGSTYENNRTHSNNVLSETYNINNNESV